MEGRLFYQRIPPNRFQDLRKWKARELNLKSILFIGQVSLRYSTFPDELSDNVLRLIVYFCRIYHISNKRPGPRKSEQIWHGADSCCDHWKSSNMLDIETFPPQDKQNCLGTAQQDNWDLRFKMGVRIMSNEKCDIAIAMSSSRADPVLGFIILSYCPGWGYLNI